MKILEIAFNNIFNNYNFTLFLILSFLQERITIPPSELSFDFFK